MTVNAFMVIDVDDRQLAAQIARLQHRVSNPGLEEFLEDIADPYLKDRVTARFASEGDDAVNQWLPLDPNTVQIRQALGYGGAHPINVRTRDMITYLMTSGPETGSVPDGMELTFPARGAPTPIQEKIETAQMGKPFPNTPPRPVVALAQSDNDNITTLLSDYIMEGLMGGII